MASDSGMQLPKLPVWSWERVIALLAALLSIIGFIVSTFSVVDDKYELYVYVAALVLVVVFFVFYFFIAENRRVNRYAQAVFHIHFVQHRVRDSLALLGIHKRVDEREVEMCINELLTSIANCFSVIVGRQCRASIIEVEQDHSLEVVARDSMSATKAVKRKHAHDHMLEANTDFSDIWFRDNGCFRYYLCNDLCAAWRRHEYDSSSFAEVGEPKVFAGFFVRNWNLSYRSALVLPIRYIESAPRYEQDDAMYYWGFLCVDCNSTGVFDERYSPELGGAFADLLYTYFDQLKIFRQRPAATRRRRGRHAAGS